MKLLTAFFNILSIAATNGDTNSITFEPRNFLDMLGYMGKGMLVIFVLIGVIILVTLLINKMFSEKQ